MGTVDPAPLIDGTTVEISTKERFSKATTHNNHHYEVKMISK